MSMTPMFLLWSLIAAGMEDGDLPLMLYTFLFHPPLHHVTTVGFDHGGVHHHLADVHSLDKGDSHSMHQTPLGVSWQGTRLCFWEAFLSWWNCPTCKMACTIQIFKKCGTCMKMIHVQFVPPVNHGVDHCCHDNHSSIYFIMS